MDHCGRAASVHRQRFRGIARSICAVGRARTARPSPTQCSSAGHRTQYVEGLALLCRYHSSYISLDCRPRGRHEAFFFGFSTLLTGGRLSSGAGEVCASPACEPVEPVSAVPFWKETGKSGPALRGRSPSNVFPHQAFWQRFGPTKRGTCRSMRTGGRRWRPSSRDAVRWPLLCPGATTGRCDASAPHETMSLTTYVFKVIL